MKEHAWKVGGHLEIRAGDTGYDGKRTAGPALLEPFIVEEILRLASRVRELEQSLDFSKTQVTDLAAWKDRLAEENRHLRGLLGEMLVPLSMLAQRLD
jgi:hypothetical protein